MTTSPAGVYRRGEIWWVDFGQPIGREMADVHPAVIMSKQEFNDVAVRLGWLIVVPGTSTRIEVPRIGRIPLTHHQVAASNANRLDHTTYFQCEQVRLVSTARMQRLVGTLEAAQLKEIENRLCLVLDLFKR